MDVEQEIVKLRAQLKALTLIVAALVRSPGNARAIDRLTEGNIADLQALIDECYRNGHYEDDIDYQVDPYPPLDRQDARWADTRLRKLGRRSRHRPRRPRLG